METYWINEDNAKDCIKVEFAAPNAEGWSEATLPAMVSAIRYRLTIPVNPNTLWSYEGFDSSNHLVGAYAFDSAEPQSDVRPPLNFVPWGGDHSPPPPRELQVSSVHNAMQLTFLIDDAASHVTVQWRPATS